jgi:hypothetical protein
MMVDARGRSMHADAQIVRTTSSDPALYDIAIAAPHA